MARKRSVEETVIDGPDAIMTEERPTKKAKYSHAERGPLAEAPTRQEPNRTQAWNTSHAAAVPIGSGAVRRSSRIAAATASTPPPPLPRGCVPLHRVEPTPTPTPTRTIDVPRRQSYATPLAPVTRAALRQQISEPAVAAHPVPRAVAPPVVVVLEPAPDKFPPVEDENPIEVPAHEQWSYKLRSIALVVALGLLASTAGWFLHTPKHQVSTTRGGYRVITTKPLRAFDAPARTVFGNSEAFEALMNQVTPSGVTTELEVAKPALMTTKGDLFAGSPPNHSPSLPWSSRFTTAASGAMDGFRQGVIDPIHAILRGLANKASFYLGKITSSVSWATGVVLRAPGALVRGLANKASFCLGKIASSASWATGVVLRAPGALLRAALKWLPGKPSQPRSQPPTTGLATISTSVPTMPPSSTPQRRGLVTVLFFVTMLAVLAWGPGDTKPDDNKDDGNKAVPVLRVKGKYMGWFCSKDEFDFLFPIQGRLSKERATSMVTSGPRAYFWKASLLPKKRGQDIRVARLTVQTCDYFFAKTFDLDLPLQDSSTEESVNRMIRNGQRKYSCEASIFAAPTGFVPPKAEESKSGNTLVMIYSVISVLVTLASMVRSKDA